MTTVEAMKWAASISETNAKNAERVARARETAKAIAAMRADDDDEDIQLLPEPWTYPGR